MDELENITELDINNKKKDLQKLIYLWNSRNLTPYGKIAIIKSSLISKITHVLLFLPSPKNETFNELENVFKIFIWNEKSPKFRREILENLPDLGGMKITNLRAFDTALKISWMKRLLNQSEGWAEFPIRLKIHKVPMYGDLYAKSLLATIKNKFWWDMVNGLVKLEERLKVKNITQVHLMPLWYNLQQIKLRLQKKLGKKGYLIVSYILNENGEMFSKEELPVYERDLKISFLDYFRIKQKNNKTIEKSLLKKVHIYHDYYLR